MITVSLAKAVDLASEMSPEEQELESGKWLDLFNSSKTEFTMLANKAIAEHRAVPLTRCHEAAQPTSSLQCHHVLVSA
jgi:hypothetical protein